MMPNTSDVTGPSARPRTSSRRIPARALPKRTFKDKMTIGSGADQINLYYFGPAHTGGDAFVEFAALRVMHVGDTFPNKGLPIMDKINGGSGVQYADDGPEGGQRREERRHHHQRPHAGADDAGRHARVRGLRAATSSRTCRPRRRPARRPRDAVKEWTKPAKYKGYSAPNAQARHGLRAGDHGRNEIEIRGYGSESGTGI